MKKLITVILSIAVLASASALFVSAEDDLLLSSDATADNSVIIEAEAYDDIGTAVASTSENPKTDDHGVAVGVKPNSPEEKAESWFTYNIEVPEDCSTIDFVVTYSAKGDNRYFDVALDDVVTAVHCNNTEDWNVTGESVITYNDVKAGTHVFKIMAPATFDGDTVKTPNVDYFTVNMYYAAVEPVDPTESTEPVDTTEPTDPAETIEPDAPQTGFAVALIGVIACVSCTVAVKTRRH